MATAPGNSNPSKDEEVNLENYSTDPESAEKTAGNTDEKYVTGAKLVAILAALYAAMFLVALVSLRWHLIRLDERLT